MFFITLASQCPITFPKSVDVCIAGLASPQTDVCFQNDNGTLNFLIKSNANNPNLFSFSSNGNFRMGDKSNTSKDSKFVIVGAQHINLSDFTPSYVPIYYRDISYEFSSAGSARVRSFRGESWDTYLQFLTNNRYRESDSPEVRMHINQDGKVGIGTVVPKQLLDVNGNVKFCTNSDINNSDKLIIAGAQQPNLPITSSHYSPNNYREISYEFKNAGSAKIRSFRGNSWNTYLQFLTNSEFEALDAPKVRMHINDNGKIGIGTTNPIALVDIRGDMLISDPENLPSSYPSGYRLYVTDGILSEKFKAAIKSTSQWSDYVFDKGYKLKPLEVVEQYILANKHLPNIPSTEEIIKDGGIDLAQMQAKQMEKIEELTLYLIEMKKEIELLKKQNIELKEKIQNR